MSSVKLPAELWVQIARDAAIADIEALGLACHALHDLLTSSTDLWRIIVQDLLAISPSALLSRSLLSESAHSLRKKALRFHHVQAVLDTGDHSQLQSVRTAPISGKMVPPEFYGVPGTSLLVRVSKDRGVVSLVSAITGKALDDWSELSPPERINGIAVHESRRYGVIVVIKYVNRTRTGICRLQLLHVQSTSNPCLEALLSVTTALLLRAVVVVDDTLMIMYNHPLRMETIHLPSAIDLATNEVPPVVTSSLLPPEMRKMSDFRVIAPDVFVRACEKPPEIQGVRLAPLSAAGTSATAEIVCRAPLQPSPWFRASFFRSRSTDEAFLVDVMAGDRLLVLTITRDYTSVTAECVWHGARMPEPTFITGCTPLRAHFFVPREGALTFFIDARTLAASELQDYRLGRHMTQRFELTVERQHGSALPGLFFDEWTGIGFIPWSTSGHGLDSDYATVFVV